MTKNSLPHIQERWNQFAQQENLNQKQIEQFKAYADLVHVWNQRHNITTVSEISAMISHHFQDSLQLARAVDVASLSTIVDVGSGGGFPGIPLAIAYPQLHVILIEVQHKKIRFLDTVIGQLGLENRVSIFDHDWRTFLRTTDFAVDLVCARASLQPDELIRMFKPASPYKNALLVYWASKNWEPSAKIHPYVSESITYKIAHKSRKLIVLKR